MGSGVRWFVSPVFALVLLVGLAAGPRGASAQGAQGQADGPQIDRPLPRGEAPSPDREGGAAPPDEAPDAVPDEDEAPGGETDTAAAPQAGSPLGLAMKDGIPADATKRAVLRDDLYALLATAGNEKEAKAIAQQLQRVWSTSGSDTVSVLLARAGAAVKAKDNELALKLLDAVVTLAPDQAEAWNRRAYVHFKLDNYTAAVGDLRRALALDENHFKALDGLATIFQQMGDDEKALRVLEKLEGVYPFWPKLDETIEKLRRKVEGRGI